MAMQSATLAPHLSFELHSLLYFSIHFFSFLSFVSIPSRSDRDYFYYFFFEIFF